MKWKIANVEIDNQIVLAPMAGVCDSAFRSIVKSMGCGLIETEMVSDKAIMYGNWKTKEMLYMTDYERPISQQILGSDIKSLTFASKYIYENTNVDIIDINMGCPVTKVTNRSKAGSALLKDPFKVKSIVESIVESVATPVTVKIRSGWNKNSINAVEIARIIEEAGASAITVHPRTKDQGYSGKADWTIIKEVKENISIPVIGNGDVKSCFDAKRMIDETDCDAVMIGRAALGNPWLIKESVDYLENETLPSEITIEERIEMLKRHVNLLVENKGEAFAIPKMRTHAAYYAKKLPRTIELKQQIFKMNTKEDLFNLLDDYLDSL
ncbi:tRNA dihydrouridine synthase DusB [Methanobrevibacter olleyae]|uniref:Putative TIM-barrel protein, nifR3 family n=1 Tax=Methanobrevibacter olleyae TaxID=294671 RepID=A0A126R1Z2_METOL|nr:tRNA dihydrouridine synthase DusB [Methanobrevibacter olleyae]AMK16127.1 tRNA-dihydrouridine synthase DusA [Methanobrevibacter olleyae]SFL32436.1 putative TIM-barrel protein, nifR3 family [Methanobrevibacter olleyae]